jgi:hypothetical protein
VDLLDNEPVVNLKSAEIHNIIGNFLENILKGFSFNKKRKQLERENDIKTDIITWDYGKYPFGQKPNYMIVSFGANIRHNYVDTIVEKIKDDKYFTDHSIYNDFVGELGNTDRKNEFNHYHVRTKNEFMDVVNEVSQFLKNSGMEFFNKFVTDNDFFKFYCVDKKSYIDGKDTYKAPSFFYRPSYRRILFCKLLNRNEMLDEINDFNIKCLTDGEEKYYDNIVSNYNKDLKLLEKLYDKK